MKRPQRSALMKDIYNRVHAAFAQDKNYTFVEYDFINLISTPAERIALRNNIWRVSNGYTNYSQLYKVVGKRPGPYPGKYLNVYAPIESHLPRWEPDPDRAAKRAPKFEKEYTRKPKFERQFTEKDELIIDREHQVEPEATPEPVLNLHNILFSMKTNSNQGD